MAAGNASVPARLLDITRLTSRIGRVFTGVDRVELAYLRAVAADPVPAFAVARTALGYVLLDQAGIVRFLATIATNDWPAPDFVSRVNNRIDGSAKLGQTLARKLSVQRCMRNRLSHMLGKALPGGFAYLSVGHSNLTERTLAALDAIPNARIAVLVHDTIPLDFPQYQRPGSVETFSAKLARVSAYADQVICISATSCQDVTRHMEKLGRVPPIVVAHLGVDQPTIGSIPNHIPRDRPYFVTVGTIEPRKNHAVLLDVWDRLKGEGPRLFICGARGWNNDTVFAALDANPPNVMELPGLSDAELGGLVKGARGMVFPTFAEGFGLPPLEARALGTPVICSDLPVLRETLEGNATFLDPTQATQWKNAICQLAGADRSQVQTEYTPPTWEAHFKTVFTMT